MNKLEQINALENGNGIQWLLDAANKILKNPIAMFETNDYNLKAYTDVACDDPLWDELIKTGTFSMETQGFFAKECFTEDVANADKLVILKSSKLKYDRIIGNIFNRDKIKVANIVMVGSNSHFNDEDTAAFEALADKISDEIHDDKYFTAYPQMYYESIIVRLLKGIIKDPLIYTSHMQIFYDGFEDYLYVTVVRIPNDDPIGYRNMLEDQFKNKRLSFKYAIYREHVVIVMSSKHKEYSETKFFDENFFKQNDLYAGISSSFENPYELLEHYNQALAALKKGMEKNDGQWIFVHS